jgi:uncharacterized protein (TIGR03437 family)
VDGSGVGQVLALNFDGKLNGPTHAANLGETVTLYATGLGDTEPMGVDGLLYSDVTPVIKLPVRVLLDYVDAPVLSARLAPGNLPGVAEVQVRVPPTSATGAVPIRMLVGDAATLQATTINIASEHGTLRE